ncbi:MAG: prepilin-type N-terminal cleavage/methylation domain-containing protein [Patescibacteria group bacterium]
MAFISSKKTTTGVTLTETLITIGILAILSTATYAIIITAYNVVGEQQVYLDLQQEGATAMREITKQTNLALNVTNYPEVTPTQSSGPSKLVLKVNSVDVNNNTVADKYDYFIFYLDGTTLKLLIDADPASTGRADGTRVVANFVKKIIFRYNKVNPTQASVVYVTEIMTKKYKGLEKEIISQSSAYLRNK